MKNGAFTEIQSELDGIETGRYLSPFPPHHHQPPFDKHCAIDFSSVFDFSQSFVKRALKANYLINNLSNFFFSPNCLATTKDNVLKNETVQCLMGPNKIAQSLSLCAH
jgi:hypothetical protein